MYLKVLASCIFLSLLTACEKDNIVSDTDDGKIAVIVLENVGGDLVNRYTVQHKFEFPSREYRVYSYDEIKVLNINGDQKLKFDGGYVSYYANELDVRLLNARGNSMLVQSLLNGSYER